MELIVKAALAEVKPVKEVEKTEDLVNMLLGLDIEDTGKTCGKSDVFCKCTRKCATRKCPCFNAKSPCNELCHPHNNICTNV